jgi:plastocyanin
MKSVIAPAAFLLAASLFGPPALAAAPAPVTVHIANFVFDKAAIEVVPGQTVIWVNDDDAPHTVVSDDHKTFHSKILDTGESFSFTFTGPGSFTYFCSVHPHMTGKVVVKAN